MSVEFFYDVSITCTCGEEIAKKILMRHFDAEKGKEIDAICLNCDDDDEFIVDSLEITTIDGKDLEKWFKKFRDCGDGAEMIEAFVSYDKKKRLKFEPGLMVKEIRATIKPKTEKQIWFTLKEISQEKNIPVETLRTWKKRGKFRTFENNNLAQNIRRDGRRTYALHRRALKEIFEREKIG